VTSSAGSSKASGEARTDTQAEIDAENGKVIDIFSLI